MSDYKNPRNQKDLEQNETTKDNAVEAMDVEVSDGDDLMNGSNPGGFSDLGTYDIDTNRRAWGKEGDDEGPKPVDGGSDVVEE